MIINTCLREDSHVEDESLLITLTRKSDTGKNQIVNAIPMDKLSEQEQNTIRSAIFIIERYSANIDGAVNVGYNL